MSDIPASPANPEKTGPGLDFIREAVSEDLKN
jgi:hypothetical protein